MPQAAVSQMRHRAEIESDGATGSTDWNTPPVPVWASHLIGVKCFVWTRPSGRQESVDTDKTVVIEDLRCVMPLATDVTERDRIASIKDRRGVVILSGPLRIEGVQRVQTHLELMLERFNT